MTYFRRPSHIKNEGDFSGEQSEMEENVPLDTDITNENRTEHSRQLVSNFITPQPESNELYHFNDQLYMCQESDQLRHDNDRLQQGNDQLLQENNQLLKKMISCFKKMLNCVGRLWN